MMIATVIGKGKSKFESCTAAPDPDGGPGRGELRGLALLIATTNIILIKM